MAAVGRCTTAPDRDGTGHRRYQPVGAALSHQRLHQLGPRREAAGRGCECQAPAAYCQNSLITGAGTGLIAATWVSRMVIAPVAGITCAVVPVPPTQP